MNYQIKYIVQNTAVIGLVLVLSACSGTWPMGTKGSQKKQETAQETKDSKTTSHEQITAEDPSQNDPADDSTADHQPPDSSPKGLSEEGKDKDKSKEKPENGSITPDEYETRKKALEEKQNETTDHMVDQIRGLSVVTILPDSEDQEQNYQALSLILDKVDIDNIKRRGGKLELQDVEKINQRLKQNLQYLRMENATLEQKQAEIDMYKALIGELLTGSQTPKGSRSNELLSQLTDAIAQTEQLIQESGGAPIEDVEDPSETEQPETTTLDSAETTPDSTVASGSESAQRDAQDTTQTTSDQPSSQDSTTIDQQSPSTSSEVVYEKDSNFRPLLRIYSLDQECFRKAVDLNSTFDAKTFSKNYQGDIDKDYQNSIGAWKNGYCANPGSQDQIRACIDDRIEKIENVYKKENFLNVGGTQAQWSLVELFAKELKAEIDCAQVKGQTDEATTTTIDEVVEEQDAGEKPSQTGQAPDDGTQADDQKQVEADSQTQATTQAQKTNAEDETTEQNEDESVTDKPLEEGHTPQAYSNWLDQAIKAPIGTEGVEMLENDLNIERLNHENLLPALGYLAKAQKIEKPKDLEGVIKDYRKTIDDLNLSDQVSPEALATYKEQKEQAIVDLQNENASLANRENIPPLDKVKINKNIKKIDQLNKEIDAIDYIMAGGTNEALEPAQTLLSQLNELDSEAQKQLFDWINQEEKTVVEKDADGTPITAEYGSGVKETLAYLKSKDKNLSEEISALEQKSKDQKEEAKQSIEEDEEKSKLGKWFKKRVEGVKNIFTTDEEIQKAKELKKEQELLQKQIQVLETLDQENIDDIDEKTSQVDEDVLSSDESSEKSSMVSVDDLNNLIEQRKGLQEEPRTAVNNEPRSTEKEKEIVNQMKEVEREIADVYDYLALEEQDPAQLRTMRDLVSEEFHTSDANGTKQVPHTIDEQAKEKFGQTDRNITAKIKNPNHTWDFEPVGGTLPAVSSDEQALPENTSQSLEDTQETLETNQDSVPSEQEPEVIVNDLEVVDAIPAKVERLENELKAIQEQLAQSKEALDSDQDKQEYQALDQLVYALSEKIYDPEASYEDIKEGIAQFKEVLGAVEMSEEDQNAYQETIDRLDQVHDLKTVVRLLQNRTPADLDAPALETFNGIKQELIQTKQEQRKKFDQITEPRKASILQIIDQIFAEVVGDRNLETFSKIESKELIFKILNQYVQRVNPNLQLQKKTYPFATGDGAVELTELVLPQYEGSNFEQGLKDFGLNVLVTKMDYMFSHLTIDNGFKLKVPRVFVVNSGLKSKDEAYKKMVLDYLDTTQNNVGSTPLESSEPVQNQVSISFFIEKVNLDQ